VLRLTPESPGTNRDGEQHTVDQHHHRDDPLEDDVLGDVVGEGPDLPTIGSGRQVERLGDLQTLLEVTPTPLVDGQQSRALVLRVIGNDHAHKQRQADHAAQEYVDVNIDRMYL